jgi:uncharacterized protein YndB with AHSA1/START domain
MTRSFEFTRVLDAPRRLVFDTWTQPKHIQQWMLGSGRLTMPECENRPSARRLQALRLAQGRSAPRWRLGGTVREVKPPELLVTTERVGAPSGRRRSIPSRLTDRAADDGDSHRDAIPRRCARRGAQDRMKEGMDPSFAGSRSCSGRSSERARIRVAGFTAWLERHGSKTYREAMLTRYGITATPVRMA